MATKTEKLTSHQKNHHSHVISVAKSNLDLVINQLESLANAMYDETLEMLDQAKQDLDRVRP